MYTTTNSMLTHKPKTAWVHLELILFNDTILSKISQEEKCAQPSSILDGCALIEDLNAFPRGV